VLAWFFWGGGLVFFFWRGGVFLFGGGGVFFCLLGWFLLLVFQLFLVLEAPDQPWSCAPPPSASFRSTPIVCVSSLLFFTSSCCFFLRSYPGPNQSWLFQPSSYFPTPRFSLPFFQSLLANLCAVSKKESQPPALCLFSLLPLPAHSPPPPPQMHAIFLLARGKNSRRSDPRGNPRFQKD